jgi:hypothetical protein
MDAHIKINGFFDEHCGERKRVSILTDSLRRSFAMHTIDRRSDDDGVSSGTTITIVGSLTGISALFVAARLYVRIKLMRAIGLDDYLIVLAMVWLPKTVSLSTLMTLPC